MQTWTETVEGVEYLIVQRGDVIHQIDLKAISSWGLLLGITDEAAVVAQILRYKEEKVETGQPNLWTPLYATLNVGLDEMSKAGVPAEFMEDVLASDAPVPGAEIVAAIETAREEARTEIATHPDVFGDISVPVDEALADKKEKIKDSRVEFVDLLAPVYELPPPVAPTSTPEALDMANLAAGYTVAPDVTVDLRYASYLGE